MAAEIVKGLGVVWGVAGFAAGATGISSNDKLGDAAALASATGKVQSVKYDLDGKTAEVSDENGDCAAVIFFADTEKITVEVVPSGATIAAAVLNWILPARGADVTITDTVDTEITTKVFMFMRGTKNRTVEGVGTMSFELERKGAATLSTIAAS